MGVSHRETRREGKDRRNEIQKVWVRQWEAEVEQTVRECDVSKNETTNRKLRRCARQSVGKASHDSSGWLPFSRTGRAYCLQGFGKNVDHF